MADQPQSKRRSWLIFAVGLALILGLIGIYLGFDPHGLHISSTEWASIQVGMRKEEVRKVLGTPGTEKPGEWIYRPLTDVIYRYHIDFDDAGQVEMKYKLD